MKKLLGVILAVMLASALTGCANPSSETESSNEASTLDTAAHEATPQDNAPQKVVVGSTPEHYERVGLTQGAVDIHEDGYNTLGEDGTYEWWYFDCSLDDGSSLVGIY